MIQPLLSIFLSAIFMSLALTAGAQSHRQAYARAAGGTSRVEAYLSDAVDEQPQFPGGEVALMRYINSERRYPSASYQAGVQGRVLCSFIVGPDGSIGNVEVVRGVDESLNREAVRVIRKMPRWTAGRLGGAKVPVFYILPIVFRL